MSAILKDPLLQIRPMRESDIDAVMAVEQRAYPFPWSEGNFRDCLRAGYHSWLFTLDTRIVGYGVMSVFVGEAQILNLCIEPELHGQGLGRRLLQRLLNEAKAHNADTAFLEVRASNQAAIALYLSSGFNQIGARRDYYPAAGGREDALILGLSLQDKSGEFLGPRN
jgi:ribosomal-protein-alanine N-acetyltransferase